MTGDPRKEIEHWFALHGVMTFDDLKRLFAMDGQARQFATEVRALFDKIAAAVGEGNAAAIFAAALASVAWPEPRDMATESENARAYVHDLFNRMPGPDSRRKMTAGMPSRETIPQTWAAAAALNARTHKHCKRHVE